MTSTNASIPFAARTYTREVFSVDGVRVVTDEDGGWHCEHPACLHSLGCPHVEQAQRFRRMRGSKRPESTITQQLAPEELLKLSEASLLPPDAGSAPAVWHPQPTRKRPRSRLMMAVAASAVGGICSVSAYVAYISPAPPAPAVVAATTPPAPVQAPTIDRAPPVTFVNPFDSTEVFEFPAGTPKTEAHESVAELLLQRARQRLAAAPE